MSAQILDGKLLAGRLKEKLSIEVAALKKASGRTPRMTCIVVGNDPAGLSYAASQAKTAESLGIHYELQNLKADVSQQDVLTLIDELNNYEDVHGVIINKPLPAHIDFKTVINAVAPDKDVEGMNLVNLGRLFLGQTKLIPCTPASVMAHLNSIGMDLKGKKAVVIGRSEIVGKPVALLLLREDITVTVCHSKTIDLHQYLLGADIVVAAIGKKHFLKGDSIKSGAVVIDVGINDDNGKIAGDVDFASCQEKASYITPVPGGVGPVTSVMLMSNTIEAFKLQVRR